MYFLLFSEYLILFIFIIIMFFFKKKSLIFNNYFKNNFKNIFNKILFKYDLCFYLVDYWYPVFKRSSYLGLMWKSIK